MQSYYFFVLQKLKNDTLFLRNVTFYGIRKGLLHSGKFAKRKYLSLVSFCYIFAKSLKVSK